MIKKPLYTILYKIFVKTFYQAHLGLFLFLLLLFFGALQPSQLLPFHKGLVHAIFGNVKALLLFFTCCTLYFLKVYLFLRKLLHQRTQQFLQYSLFALHKRERYGLWTYIIVLNTLPISLYALLCIFTGFYFHYFAFPIFILLGMFTLIYLSVISYEANFHKSSKRAGKGLTFPRYINSSYTFLAIRYLLQQQKVTFLLSKALSYLLIVGLLQIFSDVKGNIHLLEIVITAVVIAHVMFLHGQFIFENQQLALFRNLPFSRSFCFLVVYKRISFFFLAELFWLVVRYPLSTAVRLMFFMLSFALLLYNINTFFANQVEALIKFVFLFFIVLIILILFDYAVLLSFLFIFSSWLIARYSHPTFETN